jgi:hypothetical protein
MLDGVTLAMDPVAGMPIAALDPFELAPLARERRLIKLELLKKGLALCRIELAEFLFDLGRNSDPLEALFTKVFLQFTDQILLCQPFLPDVDNHDNRFPGSNG